MQRIHFSHRFRAALEVLIPRWVRNPKRRVHPWLLALVVGLLPFRSEAVLDIRITEGVEGDIPIAVVAFEWVGAGQAPSQDVSAIVEADLRRTGRFSLVPEQDFLERPHEAKDVNFDNWQTLGVEALVIGRVRPDPQGGYRIEFRLFDIFKKTAAGAAPVEEYETKQLLGHSLHATADSLRYRAHHISDLIYEELTGERGVFRTRIAYVTAEKNASGEQRYSLQVADADGHDPFRVLTSSEPIMSPAWSPDGRHLAYVSFQGARSAVYVQDLSSERAPEQVAAFPGINGAPAWSPKGDKLALTLSRAGAGNPEVYVLDLQTRRLERITYNSAIDTEPVWSPDGRVLVFTSDRSGRPQLYRVPVGGGRAQRITFEGTYNARAAFSPDGSLLAMVHGQKGRFRIAVVDLESGLFRVLTDGKLDESPTFAPNGRMIIYATGGQLGVVTVDGQETQRLILQEGDVREPAWGPITEE